MTTTNLSERSLGWLRYLYRKAKTPDDWSKEGTLGPYIRNPNDSNAPLPGRELPIGCVSGAAAHPNLAYRVPGSRRPVLESRRVSQSEQT